MDSEILQIACHLEAQVQELFSLLENRKRNLEAEVEELLESEPKKQKRNAFFFSPPSDDFDSSFSRSEDSRSDDSEDFIDIGEFETMEPKKMRK